MHAGPFESEIAKLSQKLAQNPASRIFAPLADAYRKTGRIAEAIEVCERGLGHHPAYLSAQMVLARCHYDRGDLEAAARAFREVLGADPQNLVALRALGEITQMGEDLDDAVGWYERAREVDPANAEIQERLEGLHARRERPSPGELPAADVPTWGGAAGEAQPPPAEAPEIAEASMVPELSRIAEVSGIAGAGAGARAAAGSADSQEIVTATLAEIYVEQGLYERALEVYRRVLVAEPSDPLARDRVQWLERRTRWEVEQADREAESGLGGFVSGELQVTGGEGRDDEPQEPVDAGTTVETGTAGAAERWDEGAGEGSAPWAFLLLDEEDHDPDEVFGPTPAAATAGAAASVAGMAGEAASMRDEAPEHGVPAGERAAPAEESSLLEQEDLKRFREWLKSLE